MLGWREKSSLYSVPLPTPEGPLIIKGVREGVGAEMGSVRNWWKRERVRAGQTVGGRHCVGSLSIEALSFDGEGGGVCSEA